MTAVDDATVEVIPRCPGKGPYSGGSSGIRKGHLATQVKALIQSEENPAGKGFYKRGGEGNGWLSFCISEAKHGAKRRQAAAAPSLFNTQLALDASRLKHRVKTKKDP